RGLPGRLVCQSASTRGRAPHWSVGTGRRNSRFIKNKEPRTVGQPGALPLPVAQPNQRELPPAESVISVFSFLNVSYCCLRSKLVVTKLTANTVSVAPEIASGILSPCD